MKIIRYITLFLLVGSVCLANSAPVVTNVTASQRTDGSGIVDISYTLSASSNCTVLVQVSNDNGVTWTITPSSSALSAAVGPNISPGSNKKIIWYSKVDLPGEYGTNYKVKITADDRINYGLIAYYPFNGNTNDYSGYDRHASGYKNPQYVVGPNNQAIRLVGSGHVGFNGSHVRIPFIPLDGYPGFTISLWVNHQGDTGLYGHGEAFIFFGNHLSQNISIMYWGYFPNCSLNVMVGDKGFNVPYPPNFVNNWNHLCLIKSSNTFTLYINGAPAGSSASLLKAMQQTAGLGLHWWTSTEGSNRFIGAIDEVRIYNRALSEPEILYLYQAP